ncbi:MAG TPA: lipid A biosynthesis lauroyl acyltransferase, partial [Afipia sp.]
MIPPRSVLRARAILRDAFKPAWDAVSGNLAVALLKSTRYFDSEKTTSAFAAIARKIGPYLPEHKIGRANLVAAFPEKSPEEIDS